MHVILDTANGQGFHLVLTGNSAHEGPEALLQVRCDNLAALFGAENTVVEAAGVGVRHGFFPDCASIVPTGLVDEEYDPLSFPSDKSLGYFQLPLTGHHELVGF